MRIGERFTLLYLANIGAYVYEAQGSNDLFERARNGGGTAVLFDCNTSAQRDYSQPTGLRLGNTAETWLNTLQMACIFRPAYQTLVCLFSLVTTLLSVISVLVRRRKSAAKHPRR